MLSRFYRPTYLALIHLLLVILIIDSNIVGRLQRKLGAPPVELSSYYETLILYHDRMDGSVPDGAVLFIGDSIIQGLATAAVHQSSINYGIGTDTTRGVLKRLSLYNSLQRASAVVLSVGVNDQIFRNSEEMAENYRQILNTLPSDITILVNAVLPVDERVVDSHFRNERVVEFNSAIRHVTDSFENAIYIDTGNQFLDNTGNLNSEFHIGDGLHLNTRGYTVWIDVVGKALAEFTRQ